MIGRGRWEKTKRVNEKLEVAAVLGAEMRV